MADAVDHLELYDLVRQKMQGPPLPPLWRRTARYLDQPRFTLAIKFRFSRRPLLRIQRRSDPLERTTFAYAFDRANTDIQMLRNLLVLQTLVGLEQNPRVNCFASSVATRRRQANQLFPFFFC